MRRVLSFRIRSWYFKLAYAAVVWVAGYPFLLLTDLGLPSIVASVVNATLTLLGIVLGARLFRGKHEPDEPPRPWWQMTARRPLSRIVGVLALLFVLSIGVAFIGAAAGSEPSIRSLERMTLADAIINTSLAAVCAFLYLNSAAHLPAPEKRMPEVQFKTTVKID